VVLPRIGQTEIVDEEAGGYKYTGQREVVSIGLYYYGARYYNPSIGRFVTEDTYPGQMIDPQSQNLYVYVSNNPLRYVDPTGHYIIENEESAGGTWTPPDDDTDLINPSGSGKPSLNITEARLSLLINVPYPDVLLGDPNDFYFPENVSNNLANAMVSDAGQLTDVPVDIGLLVKMAMQFTTNLQPDKNAMPKLKQQKIINQIAYEWNKRLLNPNSEILAADWDVYRYTSDDARLQNVLNSASETIVGGPLDFADAAMTYYAQQPLPPIMKSAFQPRLPRYEAGDISLTISYTYSYKQGTTRSGITNIGYFKHWKDKLTKRVVPEGGADWLYLNQLELQLRSGYIREATYIRNSYIPDYLNFNPYSDYSPYPDVSRYSTHN